MTRATLIWMAILLGGSGGAYLAGTKGWGVPQPMKEPLSIREQSIRPGRTTRGYFFYMNSRPSRSMQGGGFHGGK